MTPKEGKLQRFVDTRHGFTATLRRTPGGYVLRVRQGDGLIRYHDTLWSAAAAKATLEALIIVTPDHPDGLRGNWWTVAGYVTDSGETPAERARFGADNTMPWWELA